jgi:hypothetical protein
MAESAAAVEVLTVLLTAAPVLITDHREAAAVAANGLILQEVTQELTPEAAAAVEHTITLTTRAETEAQEL